jgi:signal transduction histidine kinase
MGKPIPRIGQSQQDPGQRAADRALLLSRLAVGLAHEGKNPLHNMVLHLQLMQEKIGTTPVDKHLIAMRDGIGKVDQLLRAFGEFAVPDHLPPDLAAAANRAQLLFAYEARRAGVQTTVRAPQSLMVASDSRCLGDLVAHAHLACIALAHDGGRVSLTVEPRGAVISLEARAEDGVGTREQAQPHLEAARRLAADASCEFAVETPMQGGARLSLSFLHPR